MTMTISDLMERLSKEDELTILELLDISSEELVEFLVDQVIEKYDQLIEYFDDTDEEDGFSN